MYSKNTPKDSDIELVYLMNQSIDIICVFDLNRRFSTVSRSFETTLGYAAEEVIGKKYIEFVHPGDTDHVMSTSKRMRAEGRDLINFEVRCRHKEGHYVLMDWSIRWDNELQKSFAVARDITDKRRADMLLKESIEKYQSTFDLSPFPIFLIDEETTCFVDVNEAALELYGYSRNEFLSMKAEQIRPQHEVERFKQIWNSTTLSSGTFKSAGLIHRKKNGECIQVDLKINPITLHGRQTRLVAILDVTQSLAYEAQLMAINKQLKNAEEIAKLGYWEAALDDSYSFWSDETYRIWGLERDTFQPDFKKYLNTIHPEDQERFYSYQNKIIQGKNSDDFEYRIVLPDQSVKYIFQRTALVSEAKGIPQKLQGIVLDITSQKQREQEIQLSNDRFEMVLKATNEAIWDWDILTGKSIWGRGFNDIFGYDINDENKSWSSHIHPHDREEVLYDLHEAVFNSHSEVFYKEYRYYRANGELAYVKDRGYILRDAAGNALRVVGSILDVTTSRQQLFKIKDQNQRLMDIAWTQSHLVRAPVSRMLGLVDMLTHTPPRDTETITTGLAFISESLKELDHIIRSVVKKTDGLDQLKEEEEAEEYTMHKTGSD